MALYFLLYVLVLLAAIPYVLEIMADTAEWLADYLDSHPRVLDFLLRNR